MAKHNYVDLLGFLQGPPIIDEKKQIARYTLKTYRRNDKIDYPQIKVLRPELVEMVRDFKEGQAVRLKGILTTSEVVKGMICNKCNQLVKVEGTTTIVIPIEHYNFNTERTLDDFQEVSNTVMVLGSLCRDPRFRILPNTSTPSTQYQLAVNRKYRVERQPYSRTDYPWVNSFGYQAEEDMKRLEEGSQVFVEGGLQTRTVYRKIQCGNEECNAEFKAEDFVGEIVPYSVEYLNNCKFDTD